MTFFRILRALGDRVMTFFRILIVGETERRLLGTGIPVVVLLVAVLVTEEGLLEEGLLEEGLFGLIV
jgi:hypothetical protein